MNIHEHQAKDLLREFGVFVPKGFVRLLGKLASLTDNGTKIHLFVGNHDLWTFGYLETELGLNIYRKPCIVSINNKKIYIAHGDGLGKGNTTYKFVKGIYENCICQWFFKVLPSNLGISLAQFLSRTNKIKTIIFSNIYIKMKILFEDKKIRERLPDRT